MNAIRARSAFKWLARIFAAAIAIQVFLAGLAMFWSSDQWASHTGFSRFLIVPPILMLIASIIARMPVSFRLSTVALIVLLVLMGVSAHLPSDVGYLSALHPVLALMMFFGTASLARRTDALDKD
ncbi:MAG: hypothetical protein J7559_15975, partial [Cohnella sp.]|nr:hypothetical protein [Cohnella sp.]